MIYYHGTVEAWLPMIQKQGLRPVAENAWQISNFIGDLRKMEKTGWIYLTTEKLWGERFAKAKAEYLATEPGHSFSSFVATKNQGAPVLITKPVLLTLDIPSHLHLTLDPRSSQESGFKYHGSIPPTCITHIEHLRS